MGNTIGWGYQVADKRRIKNTIRQLQRVKTWQLFILLILAVFLSATFLRLNNIGMVERRNAVTSADTAGNDDITISRLYDLQQYVTAHMNTSMGKGMYLTASYKRDVQTAYTAASSDSNPNGNIYEKAQEVCAPQFTHYSTAYLQCTISQLKSYPAGSSLVSAVNLPNPNLYLRDYVSPVWSPDIAGWSVVVCVILALMIVVRILSLIVLRLLLHRHYRSI